MNARTQEQLRQALGADQALPVRTSAQGPWGVMELAAELADHLQQASSRQSGRPTDQEWEVRRLVGFHRDTWETLAKIAAEVSSPTHRVSPAQVAAALLEQQVAKLAD